MGRNNRQRRAAKQKVRARRGPTPARSHDAHRFVEDLDDDILADLLDDLLDDPPTFLDPPPRLTTTDRAQRLIDSWLGTARRQADGAVLRIWAGHQLQSVDDAVLRCADGILGHRLLAHVARLWDAGWQPRDLLHVTQRIDRRATALTADLAVEQLNRSGRLDLAPEAWREQLDIAGAVAADAGLRPVGDRAWTPLDRLAAAGSSPEEAVSSLLRLVVRLEQLPVLATTLPPPSAWRLGSTRPTPSPARQPTSSTADGRREKVLGTVRALLAKAESTDYAAEAEALTAKAQDLMTRHAIDEALLHAGNQESVDVRAHRVLIDSPYPYEKVTLLNAVGRANRVRVIWLEGLAMATVVGTPVDVDQAELLYISLLIQATRAMTEAGANRVGSFDRSPSFRRAFLTSYAIRIGERLADADEEATSSYGSALVPVLKRQQEAVDAEFDRMFPDTHSTGARRSYDRRGWDAGREAADDAVFVAGRLAG